MALNQFVIVVYKYYIAFIKDILYVSEKLFLKIHTKIF